MKSVVIVGLGLIGGSLGLALRSAGLNGGELVGYARNPQTAARAVELGAVDRTCDTIALAVDAAELIILAVPTMAVPEIMEEIVPHLKPGCTVTDTASTKAMVMEWAEDRLPATVSFIGGHPMAGKESAGIEFAEASLFRGCMYCLVPGRNASRASTDLMVELVGRIGGIPLFVGAPEHDKLVAGISHLPLILSSSLVLTTTQSPVWKEMSKLAATGYRDVSRLASQHARMNRDICLTNRDNILHWIDEFAKELAQFRQSVSEGSDDLEKTFLIAQQAREAWLDDYGKRG